MVYNKSKKQKKINKYNKTRKRVGGNCGCNKLFKGGSTTHSYSPLNQDYGTPKDPLTSFNFQNTRFPSSIITTPTNLFGGKYNRKQKKRKSKKIKGGNYFNNATDQYLNNTLTNNSLRSVFGYQNNPTTKPCLA